MFNPFIHHNLLPACTLSHFIPHQPFRQDHVGQKASEGQLLPGAPPRMPFDPPGTSEAMFEAVLHDDEELLQRRVVRVQRPAEAQRRLDEALDAELGHVQQVGPLHGRGVPQSCREKRGGARTRRAWRSDCVVVGVMLPDVALLEQQTPYPNIGQSAALFD